MGLFLFLSSSYLVFIDLRSAECFDIIHIVLAENAKNVGDEKLVRKHFRVPFTRNSEILAVDYGILHSGKHETNGKTIIKMCIENFSIY